MLILRYERSVHARSRWRRIAVRTGAAGQPWKRQAPIARIATLRERESIAAGGGVACFNPHDA